MIGWEAKASLVLTNAELKLKSHQMTRRKAKVFPSPHCSKSATKVHQCGEVICYRLLLKCELSNSQTHPRYTAERSLCVSFCQMCAHFNSAYFQLSERERERERTSFYHLNCNCGTTRSFCCSLLTGSLTFLHTRVTLPAGVVCAFMSRQRCSLFCETLFTHSSFNTTRLFSHH